MEAVKFYLSVSPVETSCPLHQSTCKLYMMERLIEALCAGGVVAVANCQFCHRGPTRGLRISATKLVFQTTTKPQSMRVTFKD